MPAMLASVALAGLERFASRGARAVVVPTAAARLSGRTEIAAPVLEQLGDLGVQIRVADVADASLHDMIASASVVVVTGGDPFHLLAEARRGHFAAAAQSVLDRGGTYCGISAGAMVAAPSLVPVPRFSPFAAPQGLDLDGLGLVPLLVLPHDDRPGRRARHEAALREYGRVVPMVALRDDEQVVIDEAGSWRLESAGLDVAIRPAVERDAAEIAAVYLAAGTEAWSWFLGPGVMSEVPDPEGDWRARVGGVSPPEVFVAGEGDGVCGFVWARPGEVGEAEHEVVALYTHPRVWGRGIGRRLLDHGLDVLRASGARDAVLWTEERNHRARRIYERDGWVTDGAVREKHYGGQVTREARYRRAV
jgi:dipeptidase E